MSSNSTDVLCRLYSSGAVSYETSMALIWSKTQPTWGKRCSPSYIHDMMSTLSKNNSVEKLVEIDLIGFGFLMLVPNWSVKQAIMVHLVESYQVKPRTFILDIGNIRLNAELIGKVFGIPSRGDPFPALDDSNLSHVAIKNWFHRQTTTELRDLVYSCPMATESDRMEFRRYFILVVMKMFLCPTTQQILYFQRLQYGVLDNCLEHEPWLVAWTSERLEMKAQYILSEGRLLTRYGGGEDIKGRSPQAARKKPQKRGRKDSVPPRGRSVDGESKQVSKERRSRGRTTSPPLTRRSSRRGERSKSSPRGSCERKGGEAKKDRSCRSTPIKSKEKDLPISTNDDEENEPLAKRMCRLYNQGVDQQKPSAEPAEGNLNQDKGTHETPVSIVPDAGTLSVAQVKHEEWEFDGQVS
ncbi:uncharacterized protein DS421_16g535300 [Arachis hypogaea]|nr:uncharacterized protein DS421_16g535300 [Arachis hypogaea]